MIEDPVAVAAAYVALAALMAIRGRIFELFH
jgi:hypothetical protein